MIVWLWTRLWICLYLFNSLEGINPWAYAPFVNNIYAMYIMLCESLVSMLLLFKSTYKKGLKSPRMRKFSGRRDVTWVSSPKSKDILVQVNDEVKTLVSMDNNFKGCFIRVQPMDEKMLHMSNPWMKECIGKFKHVN